MEAAEPHSHEAPVAAEQPKPGPRVAETAEQVQERANACIKAIGEVLRQYRCELIPESVLQHEPVGQDGAGMLLRAVSRVSVRPKQ